MVPQDYLTLKLFRLRVQEEWAQTTGGLSLVFPRGGTGTYRAGAISHRLAPGDVLVADGSTGGRVTPLNGGDMVFWAFSVRPEHLFPLFAGNEISLLQSVIEGFRRAKVYPKASPMTEGCHKLLGEVSPQFDLDHRSQLLRVVAAILTVEFKTAKADRAGFVGAEAHMIRVFERLTSQELLTLSVDELASKFSCSRRHLNRLFHQHFDFSVAALRMEMRLLKAVSLLREPEAKVINVAEQCGFNHLGLFNTCFKRRFGSSPGQWRKLALEAETKRITSAPAQATPNCPLKSTGLCPWSGRPAIVRGVTQPSQLETNGLGSTALRRRQTAPGALTGKPPELFIAAREDREPGTLQGRL